MYLTKQEERTLDGEQGWANQIAMRILVRLGDLYGATGLIPVRSAHLSGVSYKHLGDAAIDFLKELADKGGSAQTQATLNPSSLDGDYLTKHYSQERANQQEKILNLYGRMQIKPTLTCTPYYIQKPVAGQHLAWAESSAVVYANSVLHAWTNREGAPSALAAALIGKTPNYGLHEPENRKPNVLIKLTAELRTEADYGALGIHLGELLKDKIPAFDGLHGSADQLKQLGAAMASSGMTALFYTKQPLKKEAAETLTVESKDIENTKAKLRTMDEKPRLVFIGCPHCSINELRTVAYAIDNKKVRDDTELWVCTSRHIKNKASRYAAIIEHAGGHVICDTCVLVSWVKDLGLDTLVTNSAKTAFYAPTLNEIDAKLEPMERCVQAACSTR